MGRIYHYDLENKIILSVFSIEKHFYNDPEELFTLFWAHK